MPAQVSIIIGTLNRGALLARAIESLVSDPAAAGRFEVIVADNGSTDATAGVVETMAAAGHPVRLVREPRKGVAYARNAGVEASTAPYVALMDDDQLAVPGWTAAILDAFARLPEIDFLAGPVEPMWVGDPPTWITAGTQGAVSIIEWGGASRPIDQSHWMCVPGGNSAYRRDVVRALGGWHPYPRSQDREFTVRLLLGGHRGLYLPAMRMRHRVDADRANRDYFRRWNETEGRTRAAYRFEELFDHDGRIRPPVSTTRQLAGVPLYLYRRLLQQGLRYMQASAGRRRVEAFEHELKVRYLWSYIRERATQSPDRTVRPA